MSKTQVAINHNQKGAVDVIQAPSDHVGSFPLGREIYVTVGEWHEKKCIGVMFGKDNVTNALKRVADGIGEVAFRRHIGKNIYVAVDSDRQCVNIRQWWLPDGAVEVAPKRSGVCLHTDEWQKVVDLKKRCGNTGEGWSTMYVS